MKKMTEDEVVQILMKHLENGGWTIESFCLGQTRGYDIVAVNEEQRMYIEAKGARANDHSPTKKRKFFDSGQLKSHLGRAIIKCLETKHNYPNAIIAMAHPDDKHIRDVIGGVIKDIEKLDIIHFWVNHDGRVLKS